MIFYLATPLLLISGIPQTIRLLKRKSSGDLSLITYMMTWTAVLLLFIKSILVNDLSLTIANGCSMLTLTTNLILILYYRYESSFFRR